MVDARCVGRFEQTPPRAESLTSSRRRSSPPQPHLSCRPSIAKALKGRLQLLYKHYPAIISHSRTCSFKFQAIAFVSLWACLSQEWIAVAVPVPRGGPCICYSGPFNTTAHINTQTETRPIHRQSKGWMGIVSSTQFKCTTLFPPQTVVPHSKPPVSSAHVASTSRCHRLPRALHQTTASHRALPESIFQYPRLQGMGSTPY